MRSVLADSRPEDAALVTRKLQLIWKHPVSRRYHRIGQFEALQDGRYAFGYVPGAAEIPDLTPLVQFPDLGRVYVSDALPAFLANRVMSKRRATYGQYLGWLGLGEDAPPVEILARTGGERVTDTFHLVDSFDPVGGRVEGRFFVSGIRHRFGGELTAIRPGQHLRLVDDLQNPVNPHAILLADDETELGWVPDWLVSDVHAMRQRADVHVFVEQVNPDAPPHLAVLCRLECFAESP